LMAAESISDAISGIREEVVNGVINEFIVPESPVDDWDISGLIQALDREFGVALAIEEWLEQDNALEEDALRARVVQETEGVYDEKMSQVGDGVMAQIEKEVMLRQLDMHWKEHLSAMDYLRQGIHLRGYAQKNPKQEYKREAFEMFSEMLDEVKHSVIGFLSRLRVRGEEDVAAVQQSQRQVANRLQARHAEAPSAVATPIPAAVLPNMPSPPQSPVATAEPFVRTEKKVGRNETCPCGSGKKYKHCHGKL
jgi:preprotein translocase subunit SecA